MLAVPCNLCGGKPEFVYYAPNRKTNRGLWKLEGDDFYDPEATLRPIILFKRLQCSQCKATVDFLALECGQAVEVWNRNQERLIEYIGTEEVSE